MELATNFDLAALLVRHARCLATLDRVADLLLDLAERPSGDHPDTQWYECIECHRRPREGSHAIGCRLGAAHAQIEREIAALGPLR
jgi:hypothetical protein